MRLTILGAGSVGCWIGGMLADAPSVERLTLIGRPSVLDPIAADMLRVQAAGAPDRLVAPERLTFATDPGAAHDSDLLLLCVKSKDTTAAVASVGRHLPPGCVIVSLQNGVHNADRVATALATMGRTDLSVAAAMVAFNVVRTAPATYRRATSGDILIADVPGVAPLIEAARESSTPLKTHSQMPAIQHGKLLLNLNNAVNALSGLGLRDQLSQRAYRQVTAACQTEALTCFTAAGITPARVSPLPSAALPHLMRAPDPVFRTLAGTSLRVDPAARSSMADDLAAGRPSEIDDLQGEIVRLGQTHGIPTPANAVIIRLIRDAEAAGRQHLPRWSGPDLLAALTQGDS